MVWCGTPLEGAGTPIVPYVPAGLVLLSYCKQCSIHHDYACYLLLGLYLIISGFSRSNGIYFLFSLLLFIKNGIIVLKMFIVFLNTRSLLTLDT